MYACFYCDISTEKYKAIISHLIDNHPYEQIKFRRIDEQQTKIVVYKISPDLCRERQNDHCRLKQRKDTRVKDRRILPKESPFKKVLRQNENFDGGEAIISENINFEIDLEADNDDLSEMVALMPSVIKSLKECGKWDNYKAFNKLVSDNTFPMDNIAFLLFLDVVRWYSLQWTSFMRYSEECKLFWSTGFKLFRGRFLRFMGGPKNKGQLTESEALAGNYSSADSKVNFVIPDRKFLKDGNKMVPIEKPGIITEMIDEVVQFDPKQLLTYKICVDGKKIYPSSIGEVNLWGYEDDPTCELRKKRIENELSIFTAYTNRIESKINMLAPFDNLHPRLTHTHM